MGKLDPKAVERISGKSWDGIRDTFTTISEALLNVSPTTTSELTTIYVKYTVNDQVGSAVFAVVWLKSSKKLVVGFSMPTNVDSEHLVGPPSGMKYKGLTKYLIVEPGESVPAEIDEWAGLSYQAASES